jgi:hypothetical protein
VLLEVSPDVSTLADWCHGICLKSGYAKKEAVRMNGTMRFYEKILAAAERGVERSDISEVVNCLNRMSSATI